MKELEHATGRCQEQPGGFGSGHDRRHREYFCFQIVTVKPITFYQQLRGKRLRFAEERLTQPGGKDARLYQSITSV
jgi:hypothetical protein